MNKEDLYKTHYLGVFIEKHKPLLQWKREIEYRIIEIDDSLQLYKDKIRTHKTIKVSLEVEKFYLNKQLQMIDDIIEQKEEFIKWLKINIKEYEELRDSDRFNEYMKSKFSSSILNYESVLDRVRGE